MVAVLRPTRNQVCRAISAGNDAGKPTPGETDLVLGGERSGCQQNGCGRQRNPDLLHRTQAKSSR
jgi:hypothetical protein